MNRKAGVALLIAGSVVGASYFQARGFNELMRAWWFAPQRSRLTPTVEPTARHTVTTKGIFGAERRHFAFERDESSAAELPCSGIELRILSDFGDPERSLASLVVEGRSVRRRVGARVGNRTVAAIGVHPASFLPTVWLQGEKPCHVSMHRPESSESDEGSTRRPVLPRRTKATGEIAQGVVKIEEGRFVLDRTVFEKTLGDPAEFGKTVRALPVSGQGLRLLRVSPGSPLSRLQLRSGDVLTRINGFSLAEPRVMLEAYARLTRAEELQLRFLRKGKEHEITVEVN